MPTASANGRRTNLLTSREAFLARGDGRAVVEVPAPELRKSEDDADPVFLIRGLGRREADHWELRLVDDMPARTSREELLAESERRRTARTITDNLNEVEELLARCIVDERGGRVFDPHDEDDIAYLANLHPDLSHRLWHAARVESRMEPRDPPPEPEQEAAKNSTGRSGSAAPSG